MSGPPTSDVAVRHPDDDLLGIARYAATLAEFVRGVQPPFTIGIYGEWGAGKSTFVNFLEHYLTHDDVGKPRRGADEVLFVPFTAWPFKTADELWRALVLTIARRLYGVADDLSADGTAPGISSTATHEAKPAARPPSKGWRAFLRRDALLLRAEETAPDPLAPYRDLVERLDDSMVSGIGRSSDSAARVDPEQAAVAVLRAAMAGLSALSPLAGVARSFFKVEDKIDSSSVLQRNKNQATRERIESMAQFRRIVRQLFIDKANGRKVVVFVDDLDRCMPDVALDLLEATKVFMGEVPCIFVVAADEQLIGQGLRLRYKDMLANGASDEATSLLTRKGQEYFEKIIQLRINVPSRTAAKTQAFVAALYPQWMSATDVIEVAVGGNPRRLRQYCAWLGYKRLVEVGFRAPDDVRRSTLLERLVQIEVRNRGCYDELITLSTDAARWTAALTAMETFFAKPAEERDYPTTKAFIDGSVAPKLATYLSQSGPLRRLLLEEPRLSSYASDEARVMLRIAESRTSGVSMLSTGSDGVLGRMLQSLARTGNIAPQRILEEDVWRLEVLRALHPLLVEPLRALAADDTVWPQSMRNVLARLDDAGDVSQLTPGEVALLRAIQMQIGMPTTPATGLRALLDELPPLSEFSSRVIAEVYAPGRASFVPPALISVMLGPNASTSPIDAASRANVVNASLAALPPDARAAIDAEMALREWAARHCFALRASAKLNALERRWPRLAALLEDNRASFTSIESQVGTPETLTEELQRIWDEHRHDDALREFFTLRPLFRDIETVQLRQFFKAAGVTEGDSSTRRPTAAPPAAPSAPPSYVAPPVTAPPSSSPPAESAQPVGADLPRVDALRANDAEIAFSVPIISPPPGDHVYTLTVRSPLASVVSRSLVDVSMLQRAWMGSGLSKASPNQLVEFGRLLFAATFQDPHAYAALRDPAVRRVFIDALPWTLDTVPWEALTTPTEAQFAALTQSIVRFVPEASVSGPRRIAAPLRVLCVLLRPEQYAQPLLAEEASAMERALDASVPTHRVRLDRLTGEAASEEGLRQMLDKVKPHILHLRVACGATLDHGYLMLARGPGTIVATTRELTRAIANAGVEIVVLHGIDTNDPAWNRAAVHTARTLALDGVPATIVHTHGDSGEARLLFIREFYRAFCDGLPIEQALAKARIALAGERLDFSSYALFTGRRELDSLVLQQLAQ